MKVLTLCLALLLWTGLMPPADARQRTADVVGNFESWQDNGGFIVVDGVRYAVIPEVEIIDTSGRDHQRNDIAQGRRVGLYLGDDGVTGIVLLPGHN